jgi:hypothetical protein
MAVVISFYKNNFKPLTQNEIYEDIISTDDYKEKLRKPTGEKYLRIISSIQRTISYDIVFKPMFTEDKKKDNSICEQKYSVDYDTIVGYWNDQYALMNCEDFYNCLERSKIKRSSLRSDISEIDIVEVNLSKSIEKSPVKRKNTPNNNEIKNNNNSNRNFLQKKTKRSNTPINQRKKPKNKTNAKIKNISDDSSSKSSNQNRGGDESVSKSKYQKRRLSVGKQYRAKNKKNETININSVIDIDSNNDLTEILSNDSTDNSNNRNNSSEDSLIELLNNSLYEKWPKLSERSLNKLINDFTYLRNKINSIINMLQDLNGIKVKYYNKLADDAKILSEKEKEKIFKIYENIRGKICNKNSKKSYKDKILNDLAFNHGKKDLKESINKYLSIYDKSYINLTHIINDRITIFDALEQTKNELCEEVKENKKCLENFILFNSTKIKKTTEFMKKNTRNHFEKTINKTFNELGKTFNKKSDKKHKEIKSNINNNMEEAEEEVIDLNIKENNENNKSIIKQNNKRNCRSIGYSNYIDKNAKTRSLSKITKNRRCQFKTMKKELEKEVHNDNDNNDNNVSKSDIKRNRNKCSGKEKVKSVKKDKSQSKILDYFSPDASYGNSKQKNNLKKANCLKNKKSRQDLEFNEFDSLFSLRTSSINTNNNILSPSISEPSKIEGIVNQEDQEKKINFDDQSTIQENEEILKKENDTDSNFE